MRGMENHIYFKLWPFNYVIEFMDLGLVNLSILTYTCDLCQGAVSVASGMSMATMFHIKKEKKFGQF